ncbi:MAG: hypothetical protein IJ327_07785, partial [Lachnospiraceae bacterium]|nr:hypothetical protein [Lachnospiraceae bacterium]
FCLRENAFLLDISLMKDALVNWIGRECGLTELAHALHPMIHRQGSLSVFVLTILQYTGLFDRTLLDNVEQVLKKGSGLSSIERRKSQVDALIERGKYLSAIKGYDHLLSKWHEDEHNGKKMPAYGIYAAILHNKGVALCGMMRYEKAAECFREAYEAEPVAEHLGALMACSRLYLDDQEYVSFVERYPEGHEISLELEQKLQQCRELWQQQPEYLRLQERKEYRSSNESQRYYEESDRITQSIRNQYRFHISE